MRYNWFSYDVMNDTCIVCLRQGKTSRKRMKIIYNDVFFNLAEVYPQYGRGRREIFFQALNECLQEFVVLERFVIDAEGDGSRSVIGIFAAGSLSGRYRSGMTETPKPAPASTTAASPVSQKWNSDGARPPMRRLWISATTGEVRLWANRTSFSFFSSSSVTLFARGKFMPSAAQAYQRNFGKFLVGCWNSHRA